MNTSKALSIAIVATASLLALSACKSNQSQQQSSSMPSSSSGSPSSGSPSSGSPSSPSSPSSSSSRTSSSGRSGPTVSTSAGLPSLPGGGPSVSLPSPPGLPGPSFPSAGPPGSSLPGGSPSMETGQSGSQSGGDAGKRGGSPGDESPFPAGDANGDGIPDTAQPGESPYDDVDFSETSGGGSSGGSAASREEQVATLDQELEGSMRDYDGRILEERAGVMGRANESGSQDQLEDFDRTVAYYDEAEAGSEDVPMDETPESQNRKPPGSPSGLPTSRGKDIVTTPPDDIPSGDDDDVVARQIREAAMKERDPDLREALWEEYRKYKNQ